MIGAIREPAQLERALRSAAAYCGVLLIEYQLLGDSYRLLLLGDVVLDVVRRAAPAVVGDGSRQCGS